MIFRLAIISLLIACLISGCASFVTERVPFGTRMTVDVSFSSSINFSQNKYYFVISSDPDYQIPLPPDYEFIEPGIPPMDPQIDYLQFYETWSGYVVLDSGILYLVSGPFTSTAESYGRIQVGGPLEVTNGFNFQFILDEVYGSELPDTIHFDLITVDSTRFVQDHLTTPNKSIIRYDGMIVTGSDESYPDIDPSLDILGWSVSIQ